MGSLDELIADWDAAGLGDGLELCGPGRWRPVIWWTWRERHRFFWWCRVGTGMPAPSVFTCHRLLAERILSRGGVGPH
jgi:hypothetical protein